MILKLKRTPGIYLVGFMGCGKSTIGRALAEELGWSFCDLDEEIERREGATIGQIFEQRGEAAFREAETATLRARVRTVALGQPHVISLGGGALVCEENFSLVSEHGVTVWIDAPFTVIERRVAAETHRPLARDPVQLRTLFDARRAAYAQADYRVEAPDDSARGVVEQILALPLFKP
jgi:shikimate kinase